MEAVNVNGFVRTWIIKATLSELPKTPLIAPYLDVLYISSTSMKILIDDIVDNGGSSIENFEIQQDDSKGGLFKTIFGGELSPTVGRSVTIFNQTKGVLYRFRYRAKNAVGWSDWSPISRLKASGYPSIPPWPTYIWSDNISITLSFRPSDDDGGDQIIWYELWVLQSSTEVVNSYDYITHRFEYKFEPNTTTYPKGTIF